MYSAAELYQLSDKVSPSCLSAEYVFIELTDVPEMYPEFDSGPETPEEAMFGIFQFQYFTLIYQKNTKDKRSEPRMDEK